MFYLILIKMATTTNIYRIFPVLWNDGICKQAQTVYAIDRAPPPDTLRIACSSRVKEDPAYYWDSSTFQRLLPPSTPGCCYQPEQLNAVTWSTLPAWLSYAQSTGYVLNVEFSRLKPFSDIYITGP
jgi:hypothetical protein